MYIYFEIAMLVKFKRFVIKSTLHKGVERWSDMLNKCFKDRSFISLATFSFKGGLVYNLEFQCEDDILSASN